MTGPAGSLTPIADLLAGSDLPRHEGERLLAAAAGTDRTRLWTRGSVPPEVADRFRDLAAARSRGVPLQHLEGTVEFGPITLAIDGRALVPRPETEVLWDRAVREAPEAQVVVDLCTGSGNLALALRHALPGARVHATDISRDALTLARENGARLGLDVSWHEGDLFSPLPPGIRGRVDVLVANPPYLAAGDTAGLPPEVRHDPEIALVAGDTGLEVLERIAAGASGWLRPGAPLLVEIGEGQSADARRLFAVYRPEILPDMAGRPRIVLGRCPGS